jgi:hypothetical protein
MLDLHKEKYIYERWSEQNFHTRNNTFAIFFFGT